jgi:hypothetical protein
MQFFLKYFQCGVGWIQGCRDHGHRRRLQWLWQGMLGLRKLELAERWEMSEPNGVRVLGCDPTSEVCSGMGSPTMQAHFPETEEYKLHESKEFFFFFFFALFYFLFCPLLHPQSPGQYLHTMGPCWVLEIQIKVLILEASRTGWSISCMRTALMSMS